MEPFPLFAAAGGADAGLFWQYCFDGLVIGMLYALIALGYTMVYGIVELINFAHGDLFMLGTFMGLTILSMIGLNTAFADAASAPSMGLIVVGCAAMYLVVPPFCAVLNVSVDRIVYRPLRNAPKLAPLVSAIGVSFIFMNLGEFWNGMLYQDGKAVPAASVRDFPNLIGEGNILGPNAGFRISWKDVLVIGVTVPSMVFLTWFVKFTKTGKAMRATAQNPVAARLMGIDVDRVIAVTFAIGGALGGVGSVTYALFINTTGYQVGFQNGLYAFTAAVLGGIGNIPGAVLGGLLIGLVRKLGVLYFGATWESAMVFAILILILVFRPTGLLGARTREKV